MSNEDNKMHKRFAERIAKNAAMWKSNGIPPTKRLIDAGMRIGDIQYALVTKGK